MLRFTEEIMLLLLDDELPRRKQRGIELVA